MYEVK